MASMAAFDSALPVATILTSGRSDRTHRHISGDDLIRFELKDEAMRLATVLYELMPQEPEAAGLLALMLFHDTRTPARANSNEGFVPLEHQDRNLWDKAAIDRGDGILRNALSMGRAGPYQLQAAIAAVQASSSTGCRSGGLRLPLRRAAAM